MEEKLKGEYKINSSFTKWCENFWYHYKWHTVTAVFLLVAGMLLLLQTCSRVSYDGYILYAGNHEITMTSPTGDVAPYDKLCSTLEDVCCDFDKDGEVNVTLLNLFVINQQEAEELLEKNSHSEINTSLVSEDTNRLGQTMLYGDYYVCFLSERLFLEYEEMYSGALFCDLSPYLKDGEEYEKVSERGIYLRSLKFCNLPGISSLPSDTVVCLRALSEVSGAVNREQSTESFRRGEEIIKNIFSYTK